MTYNQLFRSSSRIFLIGLFVFGAYQGSARADEAIMQGGAPQEIVEEAVQAIEPAIQNEIAEVQGLTEDRIRDFYKRSAEVQLEGGDVTLEFMEKHTHDDAMNKVHMRTLMQGKPPEKTTVTSDKQALLADTKAAYEKGQVDTVETEVVSIEIAEDRQSAIVEDKTSSNFTLNLTETEKVSINSRQSCDTSVVLNDGVIQTKNSECEVEVNVKPIK